MRYPDRLKLPLAFDPERLRRDLAALAGAAWTRHYVAQHFEGDWSVLPLRAPKGTLDQHPIRQIYAGPESSAFEDTPLMAACPAFRAAASAFGAEPQLVRLMRLTPGSIIKEHADPDLAAEDGMARLHVPVITNPDVVFEVNRRPVVMAPGEAWYLRLSDPHRVANRGATDRVHLVVDLALNDALDALLARAMAAAA